VDVFNMAERQKTEKAASAMLICSEAPNFPDSSDLPYFLYFPANFRSKIHVYPNFLLFQIPF